MVSGEAKTKLIHRIRRIEGQIGGIRRMVEDDTYCVDVLTQIAAVEGAVRKVSEILLTAHLNTCVAKAFNSGDEGDRDSKIEELVTVLSRWGGFASRAKD